MKTLTFDKSIILSFFITDIDVTPEMDLDSLDLNFLSFIRNSLDRPICILCDNSDEHGNTFHIALNWALKLSAAGLLIPLFSSEN